MHPISQLKSMREAAERRLGSNPDYRLMVSLDSLIVDLQEVGKLDLKSWDNEEAWAEPKVEAVNDHYELPTGTRDEVFDHLASEVSLEDDLEEDEETDQPAVSFG